MSEWVRLDVQQFSKPKRLKSHGVEINVVMSPYDVPEAVRGNFDQVLKQFVIEFRYIDDEPVKREKHGEHIALRIGRHSGRLYGIEVDVNAMEADAVGLHVQLPKAPEVSAAVIQAINTLAHKPAKQPRQENYEVAKDAITRKGGEIFAELAPA